VVSQLPQKRYAQGFIGQHLPLYFTFLMVFLFGSWLLTIANLRHRYAQRQSEYERRFRQTPEDTQMAVEFAPHNAGTYFNRAATHDAMGKRDMAIADMQRFLELTENADWKKAAEDILKRWNEEKKEQATGKQKEEG
jgi:tetratricopeptide (TPR) repeat protein